MLSLGRERSIDEGFSNNTHFCQLSGEAIPFNDATFDVNSMHLLTKLIPYCYVMFLIMNTPMLPQQIYPRKIGIIQIY